MFQIQVSHLIGEEFESVPDELPAKKPLDEGDVDDDVEKVEDVTEHQLEGPEVVAPIEVLNLSNILQSISWCRQICWVQPADKSGCHPAYHF